MRQPFAFVMFTALTICFPGCVAGQVVPQIDSRVESQVELGYTQLKGHQYDEAVRSFTQALAIVLPCGEVEQFISTAFEFQMARGERPKDSLDYLRQPEFAAGLAKMGFACALGPETFEDTAHMAPDILIARGDAQRALSNIKDAESDYYYADKFWWGADRAKARLCDLGIQFPGEYPEVTLSNCREAFASVYSILHGITDPESGVRIADVLLRDGDVSSACMVVFPPYVDGPPEVAAYLQDEGVKKTQERVRTALKSLGMTRCHIDLSELQGPKKGAR